MAVLQIWHFDEELLSRFNTLEYQRTGMFLFDDRLFLEILPIVNCFIVSWYVGQISLYLYLSPNEVFSDIMVLASPLRPPVDPDYMSTLFNLSLSNFI